jgi:hypothetical protein
MAKHFLHGRPDSCGNRFVLVAPSSRRAEAVKMAYNHLLRQARLEKLWTIRQFARKLKMDERTVLQ